MDSKEIYEVLRSYCSDKRLQLSRFIVIDDTVYVSDSYCMLVMPVEYLKSKGFDITKGFDTKPDDSTPKFKAVPSTAAKDTEYVTATIEEVHNISKQFIEGEHSCPECGGAGTVTYWYKGKHSDWYDEKELECPVCKGTRETFRNYLCEIFKDIYVDMQWFTRLYNLMKVFSKDTVNIYMTSDTTLRFDLGEFYIIWAKKIVLDPDPDMKEYKLKQE